MTFHAADQPEKMPFMQVITSFDDIERTGRSRKMYPEADKPFASAYFDNESNEGDGVLYYDSDPEDARECTLKRGPRRALAEREQGLGERPRRRNSLSSISSHRLGTTKRWKKMDEDVIADIIEVSFPNLLRIP